MKHSFILLYFAVATSLGAAERDAPAFRVFPNPGSDWSSADNHQLGDRQFSWRHFKHKQTGDLVTCVAWHTSGLTVDADVVQQASIETITSDGYAYARTHKLGQPISDMVRHRLASINVQNRDAARKLHYRAIEYTYVYESADAEKQSAMAHGYVVVVGDFAIFIQHTASRVITSDIAQRMAMDVATEWSATQTSIPRGWSASITLDEPTALPGPSPGN